METSGFKAEEHSKRVGRAKSLGPGKARRTLEEYAARELDEAEVEYEYGNRNGDDEDDEKEDPGSQARVVMMYDEDGNATPMPMGRFYYDSVNPAESDDESEEQDGRDSDTVRRNVPAPLTAQDYSEEEESEYEDEDDYEDDDPMNDQFMRIIVPSAALKDVSQVKKDLDHDKVGKRKSRGLVSGMQRALSSVKPADNSRDRVGAASSASAVTATRKQSQSRASVGKIGRMLSLSKDRNDGQHANIAVGAATTTATTRSEASQSTLVSASNSQDGSVGGDRERDLAPVKTPGRQGLASVGRMLSLSRRKPQASESPTYESSTGLEPKSGDRERTGAASSSSSSGTAAKGGARAGLAQVGRMLSMNRKKQTTGSNPSSQLMDHNLSAIPNDIERREQRETERTTPNSRTGITKVGRMLSMSRQKKGTSSSGAGSVASPSAYPSGGQPGKLSESEITSPVSSETLSSLGSPAIQDRGRISEDRGKQGSSSSTRKEASRMSLKAAGRILSFSRKPAAVAESNHGHDPTDAERDMRDKRSKSVPPRSRDGQVSLRTLPSKLDGKGNKFFFSEINSELIRSSGLLGSDTHIRVPVLVMAEYSGPVSKTKWYIDAFTLPHNAVRRECIDMYDILMALARCRADDDITSDDIYDFYDWWVVASDFLGCYFEMERKVLFPWVDQAGAKDWEVQMALRKMRGMKDNLQEQVSCINEAWKERDTKKAGEVFALVYRAIDEFAPKLLNYFADQEVLLPAIVKGFYRIEDRLKMDKDMLASFMGSSLTRKTKDAPHHTLVLLVRWIANPRQLRAWISKNLDSTGRQMYPKWHSMYLEEHHRIVRSFRNRSKAMTVSEMSKQRQQP